MGLVVSGTIEKETTRALQNVRPHLGQAGARPDEVVKCGCFLADISDFDGFDRAYRQFLGGAPPHRTTVQAGLAGIKVEIDAIAIADRDRCSI